MSASGIARSQCEIATVGPRNLTGAPKDIKAHNLILKRILKSVVFALTVCSSVSSSPAFAQEILTANQAGNAKMFIVNEEAESTFRFAVIGDRTAGHRPGVFREAIGMLDTLQPEFVIGVGDLIEGYVNDRETLEAQWDEIDTVLTSLSVPFVFVPGNHDVNFDPSEALWLERTGLDRSYSHFVYKGALFLIVSTEDPPKKDPSDDLWHKYERLKAGDFATREESEAVVTELEAWAGAVNISADQIGYFRKVLNDHQDVRWTFVFMHSPAWEMEDQGRFEQLEALLADRPYSVFAGHTHTYNYTNRLGRDHITMGTTGSALPGDESRHMDHFAWVTLAEGEPRVVNIMMNGIVDKRGAGPEHRGRTIYVPKSD